MYEMGRFAFEIILISFIVNFSSVTSLHVIEVVVSKEEIYAKYKDDKPPSVVVNEPFTVHIHTDAKVERVRLGYSDVRKNCGNYKIKLCTSFNFINVFYDDDVKLLQQDPLIYGLKRNITATKSMNANWIMSIKFDNKVKEPDVNECKSNPCHAHATCTNTEGTFTCSCHEGFTGDGFTCRPIFFIYSRVDVNKCKSNPCHVNATCANTEGSFSCSCREGFTGDGFTCKGPRSFDINERPSPIIKRTHRASTTQRPDTTKEIVGYSETGGSSTRHWWIIGGVLLVLAAITIIVAAVYRKKFTQKIRAKNCSENSGYATEHIYEQVIYSLKNATAPNISQRPPLPLPDLTLTPDSAPEKAADKYIHYDTVYAERFNRMLMMNPPLRMPYKNRPRKQ